MKTKYKGSTTVISDNLFDPIIKYKDSPRKSYQFDVPALYYNGIHYFLCDLLPIEKDMYKDPKHTGQEWRNKFVNEMISKGKEYSIQGVYYAGKWKQDTFYITKDFKEFLERYN